MNQEAQQRILGYFIEESRDHLTTIEQGLLSLRDSLADGELINELFRAAHSIKGGAAMLNLGAIQRVAHRMEDFFNVFRSREGRVPVDQHLESLLLQGYDVLAMLLEDLQSPAGLSEEKGRAALAGLEPVFAETESHLYSLLGEANPNAAAPVAAASPKPAVETPQMALTQRIPQYLREMLELFKQRDQPDNRQQLAQVVGSLKQAGETHRFAGWGYLSDTIQAAIANPDSDLRSLALIVLRDLKQSREILLQNASAEVKPSPELVAMTGQQAASTIPEPPPMTEAQRRIMGFFLEEAMEHLQTIEQGLLNLGQQSEDPELINELFRAAHSIKGGSAQLGFSSIQKTAHRLEDCFSFFRNHPGQIPADQRLESLLLQGYDTLARLLHRLQELGFLPQAEGEAAWTEVQPILAEAEERIRQLMAGEVAAGDVVKAAPEPVAPQADLWAVAVQQTIPQALRRMLELFKQGGAAQAALLQEVEQLRQVGQAHQATHWVHVLDLVAEVLAPADCELSTVALPILRNLKQAHQLLVAGSLDQVAPTDELLALRPEPEVAIEPEMVGDDMADLFDAAFDPGAGEAELDLGSDQAGAVVSSTELDDAEELSDPFASAFESGSSEELELMDAGVTVGATTLEEDFAADSLGRELSSSELFNADSDSLSLEDADSFEHVFGSLEGDLDPDASAQLLEDIAEQAAIEGFRPQDSSPQDSSFEDSGDLADLFDESFETESSPSGSPLAELASLTEALEPEAAGVSSSSHGLSETIGDQQDFADLFGASDPLMAQPMAQMNQDLNLDWADQTEDSGSLVEAAAPSEAELPDPDNLVQSAVESAFDQVFALDRDPVQPLEAEMSPEEEIVLPEIAEIITEEVDTDLVDLFKSVIADQDQAESILSDLDGFGDGADEPQALDPQVLFEASSEAVAQVAPTAEFCQPLAEPDLNEGQVSDAELSPEPGFDPAPLTLSDVDEAAFADLFDNAAEQAATEEVPDLNWIQPSEREMVQPEWSEAVIEAKADLDLTDLFGDLANDNPEEALTAPKGFDPLDPVIHDAVTDLIDAPDQALTEDDLGLAEEPAEPMIVAGFDGDLGLDNLFDQDVFDPLNENELNENELPLAAQPAGHEPENDELTSLEQASHDDAEDPFLLGSLADQDLSLTPEASVGDPEPQAGMDFWGSEPETRDADHSEWPSLATATADEQEDVFGLGDFFGSEPELDSEETSSAGTSVENSLEDAFADLEVFEPAGSSNNFDDDLETVTLDDLFTELSRLEQGQSAVATAESVVEPEPTPELPLAEYLGRDPQRDLLEDTLAVSAMPATDPAAALEVEPIEGAEADDTLDALDSLFGDPLEVSGVDVSGAKDPDVDEAGSGEDTFAGLDDLFGDEAETPEPMLPPAGVHIGVADVEDAFGDLDDLFPMDDEGGPETSANSSGSIQSTSVENHEDPDFGGLDSLFGDTPPVDEPQISGDLSQTADDSGDFSSELTDLDSLFGDQDPVSLTELNPINGFPTAETGDGIQAESVESPPAFADLDALFADDTMADQSEPEVSAPEHGPFESGISESGAETDNFLSDFEQELDSLWGDQDLTGSQDGDRFEPSLDHLASLFDSSDQGDPSASPIPASAAVADATSPASAGGDLDDLDKELEAILGDLDLAPSAPATAPSPPVAVTMPTTPASSRRTSSFSNQTMRVEVRHLDQINNLVGELVVNRNSMEQNHVRLRQFLDGLLGRVQQLGDLGQQMQDQYDRSLLETALMSSRGETRAAISYVGGGNGASSSSSSALYNTGSHGFDALEMDRFSAFHALSQEIIELIVRVRESSSDIEFAVDEAEQVARQFRQVTTQLQEGLNRARMVPFSQIADRLPRAIRDLAIKTGKQASLEVEGRDTSIDKAILEELYDPMTHLVNNALVHGIETPEERRRAGKNPEGKIWIRAFYQGNQSIIVVSDDGGGIPVEKVRQKGLSLGLLDASATEDDVFNVLFHPGFSGRSAEEVDDLAGRGVGLDVVRRNISELRGSIQVDSTPGKGTTFTIRLPLTLSISKAMVCVSNKALIAFPLDGVEEMLDVPQDEIIPDEQGRPTIPWRDQRLHFQPLSHLLRFSRPHGRRGTEVYSITQDEGIVPVVIIQSSGSYVALQVDSFVEEQEIVIKQLRGPITKPVGIAGATVLGNGRVLPIADILELVDLAQGRTRREVSRTWEGIDDTSDQDVQEHQTTVLIVDDSITVRELLSMSFAKVGYRVEQARDGQDAWEKLRGGLPCDLIFCDIEMPRMDGLQLLSHLRQDPHLQDKPIAMLTSRGAERHRQTARELGATAYFTKPYLEEELLSAASRMLEGEQLLAPAG